MRLATVFCNITASDYEIITYHKVITKNFNQLDKDKIEHDFLVNIVGNSESDHVIQERDYFKWKSKLLNN